MLCHLPEASLGPIHSFMLLPWVPWTSEFLNPCRRQKIEKRVQTLKRRQNYHFRGMKWWATCNRRKNQWKTLKMNDSSIRWPAAAKSLQLCPTLCDPIDGSPPGSPVPGILQARTLGWVAISFSNAWKWKVKVKLLSHVRLFSTPWTTAYQAPLPMGFSRQE